MSFKSMALDFTNPMIGLIRRKTQRGPQTPYSPAENWQAGNPNADRFSVQNDNQMYQGPTGGLLRYGPTSDEEMKAQGGAYLSQKANYDTQSAIDRALSSKVGGMFDLNDLYTKGLGTDLTTQGPQLQTREASFGGGMGSASDIAHRAQNAFSGQLGQLTREAKFKAQMDTYDRKSQELDMAHQLAQKRAMVSQKVYDSYLMANKNHNAAKAKNLGAIIGVGGALFGGIMGGGGGAAGGSAAGSAAGGA